MSSKYQAVLWNRFKKQYDLILWATIVLYLGIFIGITVYAYPAQNINTTLIRAFGTLAILLLHVILMTGPLTRISSRFLPVLYNRRHLGVSMFFIALIHSLLSLLQFHSHGNVNPLISLFTSNTHYNSLIYFPFQTLGFFALIVFAVMAFTSHDFWLQFLGPRFWKTMHMLAYIAYGMILMHVALGILQFEKSPLLVGFLVAGFVAVSGLHLWAGYEERKKDGIQSNLPGEGWIFVCYLGDIEEGRAKMVNIQAERVAVFKYDGKLSAVHNVCKHQMGPLGEGKVIDGCITCPWHGYQYRPADGRAPAPFTEKLATYRLQIQGDKIFIQPDALPEGSFVEPLVIPAGRKDLKAPEFFVGWAKNNRSVFGTAGIAAGLLALFIILSGAVLSRSQQRLSGYSMDYQQLKTIEGWLSDRPVPNLKIIDGKDNYGNPVIKTILLVDAFKFGADATVKNVLGADSVRYVRLSGYLNSHMISCSDSSEDCTEKCVQCITGTTDYPVMEIENGRYSFEIKSSPVTLKSPVMNRGIRTLRGEIIDPKCYFGAMNPGQGKPHLSCAVRCISGGIMPVLKYQEGNKTRYAVLVGMNGEKINMALLNRIGLPVEVKGNLSTMGNWDILKADPKTDIQILFK